MIDGGGGGGRGMAWRSLVVQGAKLIYCLVDQLSQVSKCA